MKTSRTLTKLIEEALSSKVDDSRSIGNHIITTNNIFANFTIDKINKLIKGQDVKYVLNHL